MKDRQKQTIVFGREFEATLRTVNGQPFMLDIDVKDGMGLYEPPYDIKQAWEISPAPHGNHDVENCKENCQKQIIEIIKSYSFFLDGNQKNKPFPFCCEPHTRVTNLPEFKREDFLETPKMFAKKILYTRKCIEEYYDTENWDKSIIDYFEYVALSFGRMPKGFGYPLFLNIYIDETVLFIKGNHRLDVVKKSRLLGYLKPVKSPKVDIDALLSTYQKWLNLFPFHINSYFGDLKEHFSRNVPLSSVCEINMYSGEEKATLHTPETLMEEITQITKKLLSEINAKKLVEDGIITDVQAHNFTLRNTRLEIEVSKLTKDFHRGELKYIKVLKQFLKLHEEYFKDIQPLFKPLPPPPQGKVGVDAQIEEIELSLRALIIDKLGIANYSEYKNVVPSHIQKNINDKIEKKKKENPALIRSTENDPQYLLQFGELRELEGIITVRNNWTLVEHIFGTKDNLTIEFNNLSGIRNPIRHSRDVDKASLLKGEAAIIWFNQQLNEYRSRK